VVGILRRTGQEEPNPMRSWSSVAVDVRHDSVIAAELADWLGSQGIKETVSYDRIIGCPHEDGIDYPMGWSCPQCPFWASIDRFTHEPIPAPVAKMSPDRVLIELGKDRTTHPLQALESADAHRGVLVQPFLEVLERCVTDPDTASDEEAQLFCYGLYLLAKWRETRAYPLVIRWLSLSDAASTPLSGDVLTQDGARILAAVCDGDLEPIKRLMLNREADEFSRGVAVGALALLAVWAEVRRDIIVDYFVWLAREGLEREPSYVWSALAAECADIETLAVFPELRRAYDEELIDPRNIGRSEIDDVEASPRGNLLERMKDRSPRSTMLSRPRRGGRALEGWPHIAGLRSWHWPRLASWMTSRGSRTARPRRSDAMSRALVAAERSTRSAAEGERVDTMSDVTVPSGLEAFRVVLRRVMPH
jgi:hypothetical protein